MILSLLFKADPFANRAQVASLERRLLAAKTSVDELRVSQPVERAVYPMDAPAPRRLMHTMSAADYLEARGFAVWPSRLEVNGVLVDCRNFVIHPASDVVRVDGVVVPCLRVAEVFA